MKNLKQLCLFLSAGSIAALSISACGDETPTTSGTAGAATAGTGTAGTTAGTGTAGTTAGTGTAGAGTAGTATGGGGAGGASAGSGSGGKAGSGGMAGMGGASGGSGGASGGSGGKAGGGGGGSGGAPSADCTKWCSGAMGVVTFCAGKGLAPAVDSEAKCIAHCTATEASGAMGLACWNTHLANAITGPVGDHCKHASGAQDQNVCNKTMP